MSLPYFPLYAGDYEAKTSHLTLEEDGAYNRLLRLMWLTPGCSLPDDSGWIARRMRVDMVTFLRIVEPLIDEFMKRKNGRIYSPRLTEEWEKVSVTHRRRSEAGKKGGRPKVTDNKQKEVKAGLSQPKAGPKQPEPEPESERVTDVTLTRAGRAGVFEDWWLLCPRKIGKGAAKKAFAKALKVTDEATLFLAMKRHAADVAGKDQRYTPHPATWLNQERWTDEPEERKSNARSLADRVAARFGEVDSGEGPDVTFPLLPPG